MRDKIDLLIDITLIVCVLILTYSILTNDCIDIKIHNTPVGGCIGIYDYEVKNFCLVYDNNNNMELIKIGKD